MAYNKYTSVMFRGKLIPWTGPNPDKDPTSLKAAMTRADTLNEHYKHDPMIGRAYAIVVEEIHDTCRCDNCGSQCLGPMRPQACNNCDPEVVKLISDAADGDLGEDGEEAVPRECAR